jgi:hypothetical protein
VTKFMYIIQSSFPEDMKICVQYWKSALEIALSRRFLLIADCGAKSFES